MDKSAKVQGLDVPIVKLTPLRRRVVSERNHARLVANLKEIGLIEPLCICRDGEQYYILDGFLRYQALLELGAQTVPCLVLDSKDLYTPNRQVNHLSGQQANKMLRKALEKLDEKTIERAFGFTSLSSRLNIGVRKDVPAEVLKALEAGEMQQQVAHELTFVRHKRQLEILELMRQSGDWSLTFARSQVMRTPPALRAKKKRHGPWERAEANKRSLARRLEEVERHHDFYSGLYRQYVGDLLKTAIYVRQFLTRPALRSYLEAHHQAALALFESVLQETATKAAV